MMEGFCQIFYDKFGSRQGSDRRLRRLSAVSKRWLNGSDTGGVERKKRTDEMDVLVVHLISNFEESTGMVIGICSG